MEKMMRYHKKKICFFRVFPSLTITTNIVPLFDKSVDRLESSRKNKRKLNVVNFRLISKYQNTRHVERELRTTEWITLFQDFQVLLIRFLTV